MAFQRIVKRTLPNGIVTTVYPFHISLKGLESALLCRDEDDYDILQKTFYVCSWRSNVLVIEDIEMSNHGHLAVLARDLSSADKASESIKKNYSQYLSFKYGQRRTLSRCDAKVLYLDSDWYLRNALAYIPRNALDTGKRIEDYNWSSYRGLFGSEDGFKRSIPVSSMSRRERESVFRTHTDLSKVPWRVDSEGHIVPSSACDHVYLENAFNNDQAFFLKTIGSINCAEMAQKLVEGPRTRKNDSEFFLSAANIADKWFATDILALSLEQKTRLIPYLYHTNSTSVAQIARCIRLSKMQVETILRNASPRVIK